jgi:hypothetical protein
MSGPQLHAVGFLFSNYRGHQLVAVKLETHHPVTRAPLPGAKFLDAKTWGQKSRPDARALAETTQSPNRSPLERGTEIFDAETKPQMGPSAKQRPPAETHADAKSPHSGAINAKRLTKVSTRGLGGGDTKARTWDPTMQSSNQSPLYAGNGNFPSRDGRRKGHSSLTETESETRRMPENPIPAL